MTTTLEPFQPIRVRQLFARREAELHALLRQREAVQDAGHEVSDFKEMAGEETQAVIDEAQAAKAVEELRQMQAARQRLDHGTYGECQDCGEAIDARRLAALPATAFCAACQQLHEQRRVSR